MSLTPAPLLPLVLDRVPPGLVQALGQEGIPCAPRSGRGDEGRLVLFDSRGGPCRALAAGQVAIDVDLVRRSFRRDPFEDLLDERSVRCRWRIGSYELSEEVAQVDKRDVRRKVTQALRVLVERAGGIWFCIAPYPFPYRSAFNLRLDHDAFNPHDFTAALEAIHGFEHATTHFVCTSPFEAQGEALARLRELDVGTHGHRYHAYQDPDEGLRNVRRAMDALRRAGLSPSGFAAPHGRFNLGLLTALEKLGVTHSSEVGLAYDELPFFPAGADVLQIPVHPISLELFQEALAGRIAVDPPLSDESFARQLVREVGHTTSTSKNDGPNASRDSARGGIIGHDHARPAYPGTAAADERSTLAAAAAAEHFRQIAHAKYLAGEPVFLCGRCCRQLGRHPQVLQAAVEASRQFAAIWSTTLSEFARWWRARAGIRVRVVAQQERYLVFVEGSPKTYRAAGEYWRGEHVALVPLDDPVVVLAPESLAFQGRRPTDADSTLLRIDQPQRVFRSLWRGGGTQTVGGGQRKATAAWRGWIERAWRRPDGDG